MKIKEHFLTGTGVSRVSCPKNWRRMERARVIVVHYTAGANAFSSVRHLSSPLTKASAHLVIGREGHVWQLVGFDTVAWHAGRSVFRGEEGVNGFSIGIELDNPGRLKRKGERFYTWFGREVMPSEVYVHYEAGQVSYWHRYTEVQVGRLREVCRLLVDAYGIEAIVGHRDVTDRKEDPGPALDKLDLNFGSKSVFLTI